MKKSILCFALAAVLVLTGTVSLYAAEMGSKEAGENRNIEETGPGEAPEHGETPEEFHGPEEDHSGPVEEHPNPGEEHQNPDEEYQNPEEEHQESGDEPDEPGNEAEHIVRYEISDEPEGTLIDSYTDEEGRIVDVYATKEVPVEEDTPEESLPVSNEFSLVDNNVEEPSIDNGGWEDYPMTYTLNYDNTESATRWGMWGGNGDLQGYVAESTDDINVSNAIGLYCDGENVKLYVKYASCWQGCANGNDYNFDIDGQNVKYRILFDDNTDLTCSKDPGTYGLKIINGDGSVSGNEVYGSSGKIIIHDHNLNNEMEICIPLEEFLLQNPNIDIRDMRMISFCSPNITYKKISHCGAGNNQIPFVLFSLALFGGAIVMTKKGFYFRNVYNHA